MKNLGEQFPEYLWESNAGYGSKAHMEAIEKFGLTPHHRKTFCSRFIGKKSIF
jgi:ribonuclease HII